MRLRSRIVAMLALGAALHTAAFGQPVPSQMSGVPLPVADVPMGTVTVRVIRGTFANPITSQTVEIVGAATPMSASTNDVGRAEFKGLAPGTRVRAVAVVAGERLESQEFAVPQSGGIRLILVAADPSAPSAPAPADASPSQAPAADGAVTLGDDSRFVFELGEDGITVFYVLQFVNATASPVRLPQPLVFDLPSDARGAALLEGSSPVGSVAGRQLKVSGPFPPGASNVQVAYTMPYSGPNLQIRQRLPVALRHVAVVAQKVGELQLSSPQIAEQQTMPAQGNLYIAGRGGAVAAGSVLEFSFTNVPHAATWPRDLAIALVVLVLLGGAMAAFRPGAAATQQAAARQRLEARRDKLFDELMALENRYREERVDPERYGERRRELVASLERVYLALDDEVTAGRAS